MTAGTVLATVSFDGNLRTFQVGSWYTNPGSQTYYSGTFNAVDGPETLICSTDRLLGGTGTCTLNTASGGRVIYDLRYKSSLSFSGTAQAGLATSIIRNDGEEINFRYDGHRKSVISSSLGWMLRYNYLSATSNEITSIFSYNLSKIYCNIEAVSCAPQSLAPTATMVISGNERIFSNNGEVYAKYSVDNNGSIRHNPIWIKTEYSLKLQVKDSGGLTSIFSLIRNDSTWEYKLYSWNVNYMASPVRSILMEWQVKNPDGSVRRYNVDRYSQIASVIDENSRKVRYRRELPGADVDTVRTATPVPYVISPNGNDVKGKTEYTYDLGRLTQKRVISATDENQVLITSYTYACAHYVCSSKPTKVVDPLNGEIDYEYSTTHGMVTKETLPPDQFGVRAQKRYNYSLLTPKVLSAEGVLVASKPVYRLTEISECKAAVPNNPASCVGTSEEIRTIFSYNSDNLFRTSEAIWSGDGAFLSSTAFQYDAVGNLTSVDGPRADINDTRYMTYDAQRRLIFEIGADPDGSGPLPRPITRHSYDSSGREYLTETGAGLQADGSDFVPTRFIRNEYDAKTGLLTKQETGKW